MKQYIKLTFFVFDCCVSTRSLQKYIAFILHRSWLHSIISMSRKTVYNFKGRETTCKFIKYMCAYCNIDQCSLVISSALLGMQVWITAK